jgi:tetratricopeptide (TPR) repeat protein
MINLRVFSLFLAAAIAASPGCAPKTAPRPDPASAPQRPPISSEAEAIYSYLASRELIHEQKPEEAALALEKAISITPTPELHLELGNLYWRMSRFSDALQILNQGLALYPDSEILLSTLAKTYAAQGRFDDAVQVLDEYRKKRPELLDLTHEAALYRMEQGNFGEAVDRLSAIPDEQTTPTTDFLLGKGYFGLGLYDKAIASYQRAVSEDPVYFDAWVELGLTYEAQKNYIDAERIFSRLVDAGVENQQIIFRLVDLNLKLNNPDKALSYVQEYADDLALVLETANLLLNLDFYDHAAQLLDPLAQENPIPENARFYLAILEYEGRDNPEKALAYLESIPDNHPHFERGIVFRIHLLYQLDRKAEARELAQRAQIMFPRQPEFRIIMAEIHEREKEYPQALDVLLKAAETWPEHTTVLYRLALVYDRMEHRDQAMLMMEKVIAKDPEHADALNFLGYTLAEEGRDLARAEVLVQTAIKVKPDNGYYVDSLAWVYFKQGKKRLAWQEIRRAVQLVDSDPVIWEHYGDIAEALSLHGEARKGYAKSLELEGDNAQVVKEKLDTVGGAR